MAKAKKKESLTPEERLQAALVPESEQPYPVPANWCWTYIKSGFDVTSSKRVHKEDWLSQGIPFYRTRELVKLSENGFVDNELFISEKLYDSFVEEYGAPQEGDLLISGVGTIGVPYVINENKKFYFKDGNIIWFKNLGLFHPKYVYFLYKSAFIDNQIHQMASGTTVDTYTIINANATVVPLPPLPEQQRIVDRIESLFAKLDEAKQKAQDALDSFETRKAAILHKAFTGELTAQWRKEHGVGMESWNSKPLSRVTENHDSERIPLSQAERSKLARVYDYYGASGVIDKVDRFLFEGRKLLIGEDGANLVTRSKPIAFIAEGQYWVNNHAHVLSVTSEMLLDFLCHYINSIDLTPYVTGSAQPKMTQAKMNTIPVPVPTVDEQTEIVRILDDLLAKEQQAKEAAEGVLEQIDLIKKAILARAFRGELGTNDPGEESAVELLKQVL